ncbi:putative FAD-linked oxidoreductase [bioreactor metagenome]|uniref:Putative FAD-linked oxidoreductase n=1 Tax=bioreactor metagenome TaxID=1076179 RepID=A0A644VS84_9ZZZZ
MLEDGKVPVWADDMRKDIYRSAINYGGAIAAEHGTGKTRKKHMDLQYSPETIEIMKAIKCAFDPNIILNPGVIVDI